jgi:hypothetical protein
VSSFCRHLEYTGFDQGWTKLPVHFDARPDDGPGEHVDVLNHAHARLMSNGRAAQKPS